MPLQTKLIHMHGFAEKKFDNKIAQLFCFAKSALSRITK